MKFEDATVGTRIIERHKSASPKTVIAVEGRCLRVRNDAGRETSITEKTLKRYDFADPLPPKLIPVKVVVMNDNDESVVLGTFSQGVRFEHYPRGAAGTIAFTHVVCVASSRSIIQSFSAGGWMTEAGDVYGHLYVQAVTS